MNTIKLHTITMTCLLLISLAWVNNIFAATCQVVTPPTYTPTDNLLSVDIQGIKDGIIPVGSTFDVTWKSDGSIQSRKKIYEFIVFTMPHTVRFNGSGFLMLPPEVKLPFGFKFASDQMRVLFPLYLPQRKIRFLPRLLPQSKKNQGTFQKGTFQIRPLVAGEFTLQWAYMVVNECGDIVFSSQAKSQLMTFEVQAQKPVIVVQDRVGMEEPEGVFLSPSKEYKLRVFKNRFQVLYADTGELVLERAGTKPNFSPGSRFLGYFTDTVYSPVEIIDLFNQKIILKLSRIDVIAWGKNDSFLIIGSGSWGIIKVILPLLEKNNVFISDSSCHVCGAWETSQLAIDLENFLIRFRLYNGENAFSSLISENKENIRESVTDDNYTQSLQSLGFPISRNFPKEWEIDGGFKVTHIGFDEDENDLIDASNLIDASKERRFFFSYPLSDKSKLSMNVVGIDKEKSATGGNSVNRGRILRLNTTDTVKLLSKKISDRLNDTGLVIQENHVSLEKEKSWKGWEKKSVDSLRINYPVFQELTFSTISTIFDSDICPKEKIHGGYQYWKSKGNELLLFQTLCDLGAASTADEFGNLFLFFSSVNHHRYNISLREAFSRYLKRTVAQLDTSNNTEFDVDKYFQLSYWSEAEGDAEVKSFLSRNDFLLLSSISRSSIFIFDVRKNKVKAFFQDIPEAQDLESLHLTQNGRLVLQINKGGRFYFYDIATQKRVLNGLYIDDEIVLYTDDGFYDGTIEGAHYVTWHYPGSKQHFDFNQFESKFKRPDVIKAILTGQTIAKPDVQLLPPPTVEMVLKHPGNYTKQATVELSATSVRPITNMRLFMDGAPISEIPVAGKQAKKTVPLELKRGKHWITAVAYNDQGYSSIPKSLLIDASAVKANGGNLYVLGVGVNNYPNMPTANLDYAKQDIIAFAKTVRANPAQQYDNIVIKQLLDEKATPNNIYQALTTIVQQATIDDTLMLYFAGHGEKGKDGKFYFLTSQASFGDFETTGLAWAKVAALLAQTKAKVIVFLDACHSGVASQETVVPNDEYVTALMKTGKAGMVVMAASKGRQFSFEDSDFGNGHGAFNFAITQALTENRQTTDTNQNGIIELSELYRSVKFNVHKFTDGKQTLWLSRNEIIGKMPVL